MHTLTDDIYIALLNCRDCFQDFALNSLEGDGNAIATYKKPLCIYTGVLLFFHSLAPIKRRELALCLSIPSSGLQGTRAMEGNECFSQRHSVHLHPSR